MAEPTNPLDTFDHVVVLMLENRSFDNLLGYLYPSESEHGKFAGLEGRHKANPIPTLVPPPEEPVDGDTETEIVAKSLFSSYHSPFPDPGEPYPNINTQLWNSVDDDNYNLPKKKKGSPLPTPTMDGFVHDYIREYPGKHAKGENGKPTYDQYRVIMDSYPPDKVPVLSTLAKEFAVFDHWHCAVPSQTWCNRAFWHAATSYGRVINGPSLKWFWRSKADNLFTRLSQKFGDPAGYGKKADKSPWRIYSPFFNFVSLTFMLHLRALWKYYDDEHICDFERFFEDCQNGTLPKYSFLEPQFLFQHNDQHPSSLKSLIDGDTHVGSVLLGEHLLARIYDAIRNSKSEKGSNWSNTLLIITHDEHGGCYDHVVPGPGVPPSGKEEAGEDGFTFNRVGVRVPMVMVSAHIQPNTIDREKRDHTSFLATMEKKWNLEPLTARDAASKDFEKVFNAVEPRKPEHWPTVQAHELPEDWHKHEGFSEEGLHGMQRDLLEAAAVIHGLPREEIEHLETLGDAHEKMTRHLAKRSGKKRGILGMLWALVTGR